MTIDNTCSAGKTCSICGKWYHLTEYNYGNRNNRSYCRICNKEEKAAYSKGGVVAARQYRENMRATWTNRKGNFMAEKLNKEETATLEEVVVSQSYEIAALVSLLEKKGLLTREEVIEEIKKLRRISIAGM